MITVCDASPLIFLCKLRRLELVSRLHPGKLLVPDDVQRELLAGPVSPAEAALLKWFLKMHCRVVRIRPKGFRTTALSVADRTVLALAVRDGAKQILCDDRLLRDLAEVEGIRAIGTLGILLRGLQKGLMTKEEARTCFQSLVGEHGFRIGIELYESVLSMIDGA